VTTITQSRDVMVKGMLALGSDDELERFLDSAREIEYGWLEQYALEAAEQDVLSAVDLVRLIKALVVLENREIGDRGMLTGRGSTSAVYRLFHQIRDDNLQKEAYDWAILFARNPYVPYGGFNANRLIALSDDHYWSLVESDMARQREKEEWEQAEKRKREELRQQRHAERLERQSQVLAERQAIIERMELLSPTERLCQIARDLSHSPYFYPREYAEVTTAAIGGLDQDTINLLRIRLTRPPPGAWKRLRRAIQGPA